MFVDGVAELDDALVDAAGVGDHNEQNSRRGQRDDLEVPDAGVVAGLVRDATTLVMRTATDKVSPGRNCSCCIRNTFKISI